MPDRDPAQPAPWPSAAGEVAGLIRGHDWNATSLGPLAAWPQSRRTVVDVILDSPLAMAALWGGDLIQVYNDRFARLLAGEHPGALGRSARSGPATWPVNAALCERALTGETFTTDDHPLAAATPGHPPQAWFALSYSPLRREDGRVVGVLITAIETTARHQIVRESERVAEGLRQSEHWLRLAMEASSAGAWTWDARTNEASWDDRYHAMYGFAPDEPRLHEAWLDRLHPDDRPLVVARLGAVMGTPGDDEWNMEFRAVVPDGRVLWMQGLGRAVRDAKGVVLSMSGINLDITERKRAEQRLRESEDQLWLFFEYAPAAVAMVDRDMRYVAVSRRWMVDFGLRGDLIGRSHYDVLPEIPERWKEAHRRCLAGAVERSEEDRFDRADGSTQWHKWEIIPWRNDAGEISGLIILCEDITEARRWKDSQEVLIAELQHRTRNLLTVVESVAQQTMRTADSIEGFMARFGVRLRALSRVQGLLSRSDREPITIGALVRMELEALGPEALSSRTFVAGPEVRLRKRTVQTLALAIHELATNACKYGALAAPDGRLSVTWRFEVAGDRPRRLALEWAESGIEQRLGLEGTRAGYGRTLIERALPYSLSAQTTFELRDDAFRCSITLPIGADDADAVGG